MPHLISRDTRPVILIPAYKPKVMILDVVRVVLASGVFHTVVCVDDGSGDEFANIFAELEALRVMVLRHAVNLGKGAALRTGLNHIANIWPNGVGVVTADADGQHLSQDIIAVGQALAANPGMLIMGCRTFGAHVPLRSRLGNIITRHVMRFFTGVDTRDTQTGLRGIPREFIPTLLRLSTSGYDFEMEMLVQCAEQGIVIQEIPISTVYIDENASSHFRPLTDSVAIYFVLLRHIANALITASLDYLVFACMLAFGYSIFAAIVAGRIVAGSFNFLIGKTLVFKSQRKPWRELMKYAVLVIFLMFLSYGAIMLMVERVGVSPYIAKFIVEFVVFFLSFSVQRLLIFGANQDKATATETDWNTYYGKRATSENPFRKITERMLLGILAGQRTPSFKTIMEFGGGDSCFYNAFRQRYPEVRYVVVDKSRKGIEKFLSKHSSENIEAIETDLLASPALPQCEVVYSVGLIEHFDQAGTAGIIKAHFDAVLPGGLVMITYPTPTWLYRIIRGAAELLGIWCFHDERPLLYPEVAGEVEKYGVVLNKKMNWFIGLTQEIILVRKFDANISSKA